jgi:hypothetical protein
MSQLRLLWTLRIVSGVALLLALGHLVFPKLTIDPTTVLLLAVAILPWLKPVLASVELPGGVKLNFKETEKEAERVGLLAPTAKEPEPASSLSPTRTRCFPLRDSGLRSKEGCAKSRRLAGYLLNASQSCIS